MLKGGCAGSLSVSRITQKVWMDLNETYMNDSL